MSQLDVVGAREHALETVELDASWPERTDGGSDLATKASASSHDRPVATMLLATSSLLGVNPTVVHSADGGGALPVSSKVPMVQIVHWKTMA